MLNAYRHAFLAVLQLKLSLLGSYTGLHERYNKNIESWVAPDKAQMLEVCKIPVGGYLDCNKIEHPGAESNDKMADLYIPFTDEQMVKSLLLYTKSVQARCTCYRMLDAIMRSDV